MLSGVGGRTIEEAKRNLSAEEAMQWYRYVSQFGPLNVNRSLERGFAMLAAMIDAKTGGSRSMTEFMPYAKQSEDDINLETAMEDWQ